MNFDFDSLPVSVITREQMTYIIYLGRGTVKKCSSYYWLHAAYDEELLEPLCVWTAFIKMDRKDL